MTQTQIRDGLNGTLHDLRERQIDMHQDEDRQVVPGAFFHQDPDAEILLHWSSPRGRILELQSEVKLPGAWFGLHLGLDLPDLANIGFLGFAARTAAAQPVTIRACIRSGIEGGGFHDCFFDRHILAQPEESDYMAMIAPSRRPLLPQQAPWREFVLFLPTTHGVHLAICDLRFFAI